MTRYFVLVYNEKAHEKDQGKIAGMDLASGGYPWAAVTLGEGYLNHAYIWPESEEAAMRKYAASFPFLTIRELHVHLDPGKLQTVFEEALEGWGNQQAMPDDAAIEAVRAKWNSIVRGS